MTEGKLSPAHSTFLSDVFVMRLKQEARKYKLIESARSKKEWAIGQMVNQMWNELPADIREEVTKDNHYQECSYWLNCQFDIPIVGSSGETLRRWCELSMTFADPIFDPLKDTLSIDHFTRAKRTSRRLEDKGKVIVPAYMLAVAADTKLTAEEMERLFDPPVVPTDYDRVFGWVDSLSAAKLDFLDGRKADFLYHIGEARKILESR